MAQKKEYRFSMDDSLEDLKILPGGEGIYEYVQQKAEELAKAIDTKVTQMLEQHELPPSPEEVNRMGYVLAVELHRNDEKKEHRAVVLYKKVDELEIEL